MYKPSSRPHNTRLRLKTLRALPCNTITEVLCLVHPPAPLSLGETERIYVSPVPTFRCLLFRFSFFVPFSFLFSFLASAFSPCTFPIFFIFLDFFLLHLNFSFTYFCFLPVSMFVRFILHFFFFLQKENIGRQLK